MHKVAIFVEGQTELIVVRDYLLRLYNYTDIDLECRTLFKDNTLRPAEYDFSNKKATQHFQILNVGNDNAVLSRILKREEQMWNAGYQKIIGLRDMYSKNYREESNTISADLNYKYIEGAKEVIEQRAIKPKQIAFCFAIMEVETWFLGIKDIFETININLTSTYILDQLGVNLNEIDPETTIFHPAVLIGKIYKLAGLKYDKKKGDIEAIVRNCSIEKYQELLQSDKCSSFSNFYSSLRI